MKALYALHKEGLILNVITMPKHVLYKPKYSHIEDTKVNEESYVYLNKEDNCNHLVRLISNMDSNLACVYIPEKDILEHAKGLLSFIETKNAGFNEIFRSVLVSAIDVETREKTDTQKAVANKISEKIGGKVEWEMDEGTFYITHLDGSRIPFANEASGFKKLGYLGLAVACGQLPSGSVLFWDEPENSLNPELVPDLVDVLLELQRGGVQVFVATHSYDVARWFELSKKKGDEMKFINLRRKDDGEGIEADTADKYISLPGSAIEKAGDALFDKVTQIAARDAGVNLS
jgi:hypothetical protein